MKGHVPPAVPIDESRDMAVISGPGIGLSRRFYETLVAPILAARFPTLRYAAAQVGLGSEVLGFDTDMSADHDYGPNVQIFLDEAGFANTAPAVMQAMDEALPETFERWNLRYPTYVRPPAGDAEAGLLGSDHGVELYTLSAWRDRFLGPPFARELTALDWLSYSEQIFLTATGGIVFRDDLGALTDFRARLAYFPRDVWLYKLCAQWSRIAEERAYVGRAGSVGDELGSAVIAARMVGNIMRLAFLVERRYVPYPKWFGTAFSALSCARDLAPMLESVLSARSWQARETALLDACRYMAELQVARDIPGATAPVMGRLHTRPFRFIDSLKIGDALRAAIEDETLRTLPEFGAADQFVNSNFVLAVPDFTRTAFSALWDLKPADG
jgi:hypothetical protein